jgi:hypothetical protein
VFTLRRNTAAVRIATDVSTVASLSTVGGCLFVTVAELFQVSEQ